MRLIKSEREELDLQAERLKKDKDNLGPAEFTRRSIELENKAKDLNERLKPIKEKEIPMQAEVEYRKLLIENKGYGPSRDEFERSRRKTDSKTKSP